MSVNCQQATEQAGNGVAAALRGVDCIAGEASAAAFGRRFAPGGSLGTVLTLVLTLFIALFAFALLTGRTNIGVRKKETERIERENHKIAKRLFDNTSVVNKNTMDKSF